MELQTSQKRDKFSDCGLLRNRHSALSCVSKHCSLSSEHQTIGHAVRFTIPHKSFPFFSEISAHISISFPLFVAWLAGRRTSLTSLHFLTTSAAPPSAEFASDTQMNVIGFLINSRKREASVSS
jgi:hypothetical protein